MKQDGLNVEVLAFQAEGRGAGQGWLRVGEGGQKMGEVERCDSRLLAFFEVEYSSTLRPVQPWACTSTAKLYCTQQTRGGACC
jgi:hypothetical protein